MVPLTTKENRVYDSILDFPRFISNEVLTEWKEYQKLKPYSAKRKEILRYIKTIWKLNNLKDKPHLAITNLDEVQIKVVKFMDKTIWLVSGVNRDRTWKIKNTKIDRAVPVIYCGMADGSDSHFILFVDPIRDFFARPRTILSRDLKSLDEEFNRSDQDKALFKWYFKVYTDLLLFLNDLGCMYSIFFTNIINKEQEYSIELRALLIKSVFVDYYTSPEDSFNGIVKADQSKYNPINILFMILGSLYIYPHIYMNMRFVDSMVPVSEELKKALSNTIKLSKVILSDKFRDADILQKSILLKEKEYEINHD